jgi:hypothetical protein
MSSMSWSRHVDKFILTFERLYRDLGGAEFENVLVKGANVSSTWPESDRIIEELERVFAPAL